MTPEQIKEKALFIRSVEFIKTEYPDLPDALKLTISLYCAKFAKKEIEAAQMNNGRRNNDSKKQRTYLSIR